jgi:hypothetical protein
MVGIFGATPVIFRADNNNFLEYLPSFPADNDKGIAAIQRGEVYALLPKIPTDPRGYSFLVVVKASDKARLHAMTNGQLALFTGVFSERRVKEKDAQALSQVLIQIGFNLNRYQLLFTSYHDARLTNLRDRGYFDIESKTVVSAGLDQILGKAFSR